MSIRNTDADWRAIGSSEPYFGVLTDPAFLKRNLTDSATQQFYRSGGHDVEWTVDTIKNRFDASFRPAHVIDFGCGVGRCSFFLAQHADRVTGVDVSPAMLAIAERERTARGLSAIRFGDSLPDEPGQWVFSYLVFQHIPPARGYGLLRDLLACLAPRGIASIQLTAYREPNHLAGSLHDVGLGRFDGETLDVIAPVENPAVGQMQMYDYDIGRVLPIFASCGIHATWMFRVDYSGHHGYWIFGRKE